MVMRTAVMSALLVLAACGGGAAHSTDDAKLVSGEGASSTSPGAAAPLSFDTIEQNSYSGIDTSRQVVVRDAGAWSELWQQHTRNVVPAPAPPAVDFSQRMVVGVFLGARPNGCYSTNITKIFRQDGSLVVEYREATPPPGAMCTMAITAPSHLVTLQRSAEPVQFIKIP